jgi:CRISPR-associated protein Csb1
VPDPDKPREFTLVHADGRREAMSLTDGNALAFAKAAAKAFGVGRDRKVEFSPAMAKKDVAGETADGKATGGKKTKAK